MSDATRRPPTAPATEPTRSPLSPARRRLLLTAPLVALGAAGTRAGTAAGPADRAQPPAATDTEAGAAAVAPAFAPPASEADWAAAARRLVLEEGLAYFNTGTVGPVARDVLEFECRDREAMSRNFNRYFYERFVRPEFRQMAAGVADFLGCGPDELAFCSGTTEAMNYVAGGLELAPGDEILTTTHEHQAGIYPWILQQRRRGVVVRQLPIACPLDSAQQVIDLFQAAVTSRTRVLSFCHVQYTDGAVLPVAELCRLARGRGIVSVVDGAQAVGVLDFRIDALGCDLYAGSLHKWLGAPYGTGFLYVREEQRARLWPSVVEGYDGWDRYERYGGLAEHPAVDFGDVWPKAMLKYATNLHYYGPLFWSVPLALRLQQALGRSAIEARARSLAARLRQGLLAAGCAVLTPEPAALSAGIVSFRPPRGSTEALKQALRKDGIVVRTVVHAPIGFDVDRACAHWFNTPDEVERLLAGVRSYLAGA